MPRNPKRRAFAIEVALTFLAPLGCNEAASSPSADASAPFEEAGASVEDSEVPLEANDAAPRESGSAEGEAGASNCLEPAGAPIEHQDTITADDTWDADHVHIVTFGITVRARLTIAPCAVVRLGAGDSIYVETPGELDALGTADKPIHFEAVDASAPWGTVQAKAPGRVRLAYATLTDGGNDSSSSFGTLEARGDQLAPVQEVLDLDHVTVSRSASYGVSVREGAGFTSTSNSLTVSGSTKAPLRIVPRLASNVPVGDYRGNAEDAIVMATTPYGDVNLEDVTIHERGVPYRVGDEFTSAHLNVGPQRAVLTIEPGVTPGRTHQRWNNIDHLQKWVERGSLS